VLRDLSGAITERPGYNVFAYVDGRWLTPGVAAAGAIILAVRGWYWLDPAVALAIVVMAAYHAVKLIRKILSRHRSQVADNAGLSVMLSGLTVRSRQR
jgi:Co/Zn/Cd efflux system component